MAKEVSPSDQPEKPDLTPHPLVSKLHTDADNPPNLVKLVGYLGPSKKDGSTRLYQDATFRNYYEIPTGNIKATTPAADDPNSPTIVHVPADTELEHVSTASSEAGLLKGTITSNHLGSAAAFAGAGQAAGSVEGCLHVLWTAGCTFAAAAQVVDAGCKDVLWTTGCTFAVAGQAAPLVTVAPCSGVQTVCCAQAAVGTPVSVAPCSGVQTVCCAQAAVGTPVSVAPCSGVHTVCCNAPVSAAPCSGVQTVCCAQAAGTPVSVPPHCPTVPPICQQTALPLCPVLSAPPHCPSVGIACIPTLPAAGCPGWTIGIACIPTLPVAGCPVLSAVDACPSALAPCTQPQIGEQFQAVAIAPAAQVQGTIATVCTQVNCHPLLSVPPHCPTVAPMCPQAAPLVTVAPCSGVQTVCCNAQVGTANTLATVCTQINCHLLSAPPNCPTVGTPCQPVATTTVHPTFICTQNCPQAMQANAAQPTTMATVCTQFCHTHPNMCGTSVATVCTQTCTVPGTLANLALSPTTTAPVCTGTCPHANAPAPAAQTMVGPTGWYTCTVVVGPTAYLTCQPTLQCPQPGAAAQVGTLPYTWICQTAPGMCPPSIGCPPPPVQ